MNKLKRVLLGFLLFFLILSGIFFAGKSLLHILFPISHNEIILSECKKYEIDPHLLFALIKAESNFVSDAKSNKGAIGLMQITMPTAQWIAQKNDYDEIHTEQLKEPKVNIQMGCWYLKYLLNLYPGHENLALCAYNAGQGNVDKWLADKKYSDDGKELNLIPFDETRKYVERIEQYKQIYKRLYPDL